MLLLFLLLGLAYSVVNPLHEATDELRHYRFVQYLIQRNGLPIQGEGGDLDCTTQGHHPPLYYATAALFTGWVDTGRDVCHEPPTNPFWAYRYWEVGRDNKNQYLHGPDEAFPWRGEALAAHLARIVNLLFGAAAVGLTYATARVIWLGRRALAVGAVAFIAFNPMFLYMSGAINNDVVAAMAGAAATYACVRLLRDPAGLSWRWGAWLGGLFGLALMAKFNLAAIVISIGATMTWVAWRRRQWRQWLGAVAAAAALTGLIAGWWFVRNQLLYGEPTGVERLTELWGVRDPRQSFRLAVSELPYAWTSLWGRFGYGQIPLPNLFYQGMLVVAMVAAAGYVKRAWERRSGGAGVKKAEELGSGEAREKETSADQSPLHPFSSAPLLLLLTLNVLLFFGVLFNYLLISPAGPMGRFFFPALPSLSILMAYGLSLWSRPRANGSAADTRLAITVNAGMIAFALVALAGYLAPAYARPAEWRDGQTLPNPADIRFDTLVTLRGYEMTPTTLRPGDPIDIDLYWEVTGQPPGDYLLFVHLVDRETGAMIAQRDTHPGLGNFPSSRWRPGDRFVESIRLYLPETAYAPAEAELRVGLYAPGAYRLGITDGASGAGLGDSFRLGDVAVDANGGVDANEGAGDTGIANPGSYNFEDQVRLVGYGYNARQLRPGDVLAIDMAWEAVAAAGGDYALKVWLVGPDGTFAAESRERPQPPTTDWAAGETVITQRLMSLGPELAPGEYAVYLALEDANTGTRLNLIGDDGRWLENQLRLAPVVVRP